ncbi:hypothetical protein [Micromonospora vulcania]|uniref:DUF5666 domain-containing protein n=1 Tax=Micromonospora vulcania TaxID=1441873 RepID=A0ABW1H6H5_9ACTN
MAVDHPYRSRPVWAAAAAVLTAAALSACGSTGASEPAAAPTTTSAAPAATTSAATPTDTASPRPMGKLRGYTTVQQLTETADLVVRGEVEAAGFRVDEVLRAATGTSVRAGERITLASLPSGIPEVAHMSKLEAGQVVVLYLAKDAAAGAPTFRTLSGDFGVFDVTGADSAAVASTRSQAMAVTGLLAEDPAASGKGFRTTLGQLRTVAAQVK